MSHTQVEKYMSHADEYRKGVCHTAENQTRTKYS